MRDRILICISLCLFLALATFPFTYNLSSGQTSKSPDLKLPDRETACVAQTEYMRSSHMQLLLNWREDRVRRDIRSYVGFDGRDYSISLTGTCLKQCHTNKAEFCDRCHSYAGVQGPYCMDCHVDPANTQRSGI
jgi:hypothetical protein